MFTVRIHGECHSACFAIFTKGDEKFSMPICFLMELNMHFNYQRLISYVSSVTDSVLWLERKRGCVKREALTLWVEH